MRICIVRVKDLGLSYLLQRNTCLKNDLDGHLVKNFLFCGGIVCQINYGLDRTNLRICICPLMDCGCNLLDAAPVQKHFILTVTRKVSELVFLHPFCDCS